MFSKYILNDLIQIFRSSVNAVLPETLVNKSVKYNSANEQLSIFSVNYNLCDKNVYLVGAGKAVQNMAREIEAILKTKIKYGIISIPHGSLNHSTKSTNVTYYEGAKNNLPDIAAENTAKKIKELVTKLDNNDFLIVLLSGGGSALLPLPNRLISLEEKTAIIRKLANSGADITELNTVRKKISDIKGGRLSCYSEPVQVATLILSDIVGDPVDLIASGPTIPNTDHPLKALNIIKKYNLIDDLSESMKSVLEDINDIRPVRCNVKNFIIGSNKLSIEAASNKATELNYFPLIISDSITGNIKDVAQEYTTLAKNICKYISGNLDIQLLKNNMKDLKIKVNPNVLDGITKEKQLCLILSGEITVQVKGDGKGGRNQQLALEFSNNLQGDNDLENFDIYILSAGTDGIDGPTNAAGAIGYKNLGNDSKAVNLDVNQYLKNNDSYNFYKKFYDGALHVITGHTDTNVMDIHLILIKYK